MIDARIARQKGTIVDGRRVRYLVAPPVVRPQDYRESGPLRLPILFLHGLGCSCTVWLPTINEMARRGLGCSLITPDLPGYGRSPGPPEALGIDELADWITRFLDAEGVARVHVAGNSMGCQVGLALARRHPERVGALVLQGPTTGTRYVPGWRYVGGLLVDAFMETIPYNLCLLTMYMQMGPVRYLATSKKMLDDDPWAEINRVRAPTLVVRGGYDAIVSDFIARRLTAALPDAVYTPLDSEAHAIEFNNPPLFVDSLMAFLVRSEERLFGQGAPVNL
jgi:pimeloyl-ACP methyl ester carboxylesterase